MTSEHKLGATFIIAGILIFVIIFGAVVAEEIFQPSCEYTWQEIIDEDTILNHKVQMSCDDMDQYVRETYTPTEVRWIERR